MKFFSRVLKKSGSVNYYVFGIRVFRRRCDIHNLSRFYKNQSNWIHIVSPDGTVIENPIFIPGLHADITGDNNHITIYEPFFFTDLHINTTGDIDIIIGENCTLWRKSDILKIRNITHNQLIIGKNFGCGSAIFDLCDSGNILIGNDNMWSWDIYVKSDDTHTVFDNTTSMALNKSTQINIGNHVWVGMRALICKNSIIPDYCIVGAGSVVAGKFTETNCVIAGNPAKIRKHNINWSRTPVSKYIQEQTTEGNYHEIHR